jgi:hypothetical protein
MRRTGRRTSPALILRPETLILPRRDCPTVVESDRPEALKELFVQSIEVRIQIER